jgi:hypothetical protein
MTTAEAALVIANAIRMVELLLPPDLQYLRETPLAAR